ncbi:uncharacterized protein [Eschrichtius robustus]|uniref:uncharacterized protein n=1 Tax=Eschrichtius robustus TaxID=9764 RepID=UPI0035C1BECD
MLHACALFGSFWLTRGCRGGRAEGKEEGNRGRRSSPDAGVLEEAERKERRREIGDVGHLQTLVFWRRQSGRKGGGKSGTSVISRRWCSGGGRAEGKEEGNRGRRSSPDAGVLEEAERKERRREIGDVGHLQTLVFWRRQSGRKGGGKSGTSVISRRWCSGSQFGKKIKGHDQQLVHCLGVDPEFKHRRRSDTDFTLLIGA